MDERTGQSLQVSEAEFQKFAKFLQENSGIVLSPSKAYLVSSRLNKILQLKEIKSISDLVDRIERKSEHTLRQLVVEAMTTNETSWFRDNYPFEFFKDEFLAEIVDQKVDKLEIWSAACSSGQEPYSLSIGFSEAQKRSTNYKRLDCQILATDISKQILAQARAGVYNTLATSRGLSAERMRNYFTELSHDMWLLNEPERKRVRFEHINLATDLEFDCQFHAIFCRNVLIYFSPEVKRKIMMNFHKALRESGFLVLGASESANDLKDYFQMERTRNGVVYRKISN